MGKIFYKGVDYSSPTSSGVSGVKGNKETVYRVGNVNITPENVGALAENGDSKDNIVTYTSADATTADTWTDVAVLATGEKHSSLFAKISTMFKNIRYIYTHFIKSENILDTLEEIAANTQSGKVAGALAVKELNSDLKFKYYKTTVTATNASINIPSCKEVLSVQNSDASMSADQITSWVRQSSTTLYYNKSGTASTQILILYIPL